MSQFWVHSLSYNSSLLLVQILIYRQTVFSVQCYVMWNWMAEEMGTCRPLLYVNPWIMKGSNRWLLCFTGSILTVSHICHSSEPPSGTINLRPSYLSAQMTSQRSLLTTLSEIHLNHAVSPYALFFFPYHLLPVISVCTLLTWAAPEYKTSWGMDFVCFIFYSIPSI